MGADNAMIEELGLHTIRSKAGQSSVIQEKFPVIDDGSAAKHSYSCHLVVYGGESYVKSSNSLRDAARECGIFDTVITFTKRDCVLDVWKPFCVLEVLRHLRQGDVVVWADSGCMLTQTKEARDHLLELIRFAQEHASGVLRFDSKHKERMYTKRDAFEQIFPEAFMDAQMIQLTGNRFLLCKRPAALAQIEEWAEYVLHHQHLIDNSASCLPNAPEFREHRHHRSLFSLISQRRGCALRPIADLDVSLYVGSRKTEKHSLCQLSNAAADWPREFISKLEDGQKNVQYSAAIEEHVRQAGVEGEGLQLLALHGTDALHQALTTKRNASVAWLVTHADPSVLNSQNSNGGCTPLMRLAMGHCKNRTLNEALLLRLLERGGGASIAARSKAGVSAADYANRNGRDPGIVKLLSLLEEAEIRRTSHVRCHICSELLSERTWLAYFADRAERGLEDNKLLRDFFRHGHHVPLLQSHFHAINDVRQIRKELSESLAIVSILEKALPSFDASWHVVDLCCSKAVTAAVLSSLYQGITVHAIDLMAPELLPHFAANDWPVEYQQLDVLGPSFLSELERSARIAARPTVLVGMHLCGNLSSMAVSAFQQLQWIRALFLCPCCLPRKGQVGLPQHLYASRDQAEQYRVWASHLEVLLEATGAEVTSQSVEEMLTPKRQVISAVRTHDLPLS